MNSIEEISAIITSFYAVPADRKFVETIRRSETNCQIQSFGIPKSFPSFDFKWSTTFLIQDGSYTRLMLRLFECGFVRVCIDAGTTNYNLSNDFEIVSMIQQCFPFEYRKPTSKLSLAIEFTILDEYMLEYTMLYFS